jgi:signal transduction histidine kinase
MNPFRSVGARLSLALLAVVAGALGTVYLSVVPSLKRNLVNSKLSQLEQVAPLLEKRFRANPFDPNFVDDAASAADARAVLLQPLTPPSRSLIVYQDSEGGANSSDVEADPLAEKASATLEQQQGTVKRADDSYAEVAVPVDESGIVLLLSASLHDALANVHLVQRRLLLAGLAALVASLVVGYGAASLFARRIRRLERAAERIAGGRFDEPIEDTTRDELGELARAFERMRQRLAQLDHARREFIANASHELRTPLFSLGGFLELLTDEDLDEDTRTEFLETMREQVDRLAALATDLLDLSRVDAGRLRLEREPLDLAEVARQLVDEFQGLARRGGRPLELDADGPAPALGDPARALRIGRALVENALRHTPEGTSVAVRAVANGAQSTLEVSDDGPGIPPDYADHVFERFYRVEGTRASGSGLGLAIARELAELMDGRLELESRPGRTVFRLALPAAAEAFSRENAAVAAP